LAKFASTRKRIILERKEFSKEKKKKKVEQDCISFIRLFVPFDKKD